MYNMKKHHNWDIKHVKKIIHVKKNMYYFISLLFKYQTSTKNILKFL